MGTGQVFVIVTAYGDESGTHGGPGGSPIMMLAGYVSTLDQWNYFDPHWKAALLRAGLPGYFHAAEHWDTAAGRRFAAQADRFLARYIKFGYVIELVKDSYDKHYIAGNRPRKPQLDTPYSLCFRHLVALLLTRLPTLLEREDIVLNFVLEEGAAGSADSQRIISQLRKQPETQDIAKTLAPAVLSFGDKKVFPGLQASDALAFATLKIAPNNPEMIDLPQDAPLTYAREVTQGDPPVYHCRLDETLLTSHKSDIEMLVEMRRRIADEAIAARNARSSETGRKDE